MTEEALRASAVSRFLAKVDMKDATECWEWMGKRTWDGYGQLSIGSAKTTAQRPYVHRFSYEYFVGPIPDGLTVDHLCGNTSCVNPDHLEPVPIGENIRRGSGPSAINARKTHCPAGHPYDEANTYYHPDGSRHCRGCDRERQRTSEHAARWRRDNRLAINARRRASRQLARQQASQ